jgi:UDP-2,4-diacetamido-2,4,6-trideoxy-beta-L-altropyranose hydrolase
MATIAIRADASLAIGSGHVVRCLALAAALRDRGAGIRFLCKSLTPDLRDKIAAEGIEVLQLDPAGDDAAESRQALAAMVSPIDALVVDHYGLDAAWERAMRPAARRICVVDDLADRPHDCDCLLDQNYHPDAAERYRDRVPASCRLLLGPRYALLRSQFAEARDRLRPAPRTALAHLLVCFGGMDAADHTSRALEAFAAAGLPGVTVTAVVGAAYPHWSALQGRFGGRADIRLRRDATDMADLMAAADLFLGSGGSMTWERAALKLPGITVAVADNQRRLCLDLAAAGAGVHLEAPDERLAAAMADNLRLLHADGSRLAAFSRAIGDMADGRGARRVARLVMPTELQLRPARVQDCDAVHAWRNDPATRRYALDGRAIGIDEHRAWYASVLADPARRLLIVERESTAEPVGVLRYDLAGDEATISVYLVPGLQGRGLGIEVIVAGDRWLKANHPDVTRVLAEVLADNVASAAAFAAAGYRRAGRQFIHDLDGEDRV